MHSYQRLLKNENKNDIETTTSKDNIITDNAARISQHTIENIKVDLAEHIIILKYYLFL